MQQWLGAVAPATARSYQKHCWLRHSICLASKPKAINSAALRFFKRSRAAEQQQTKAERQRKKNTKCAPKKRGRRRAHSTQTAKVRSNE